LVLNTGEENLVESITPKFKGFLEQISIDSKEQVDISIISQNGILIFENHSFKGRLVLRRRFETHSSIGDVWTYDCSRAYFNEAFKITVQGKQMSIVNLTFVFEVSEIEVLKKMSSKFDKLAEELKSVKS